MQRCSVLSMQLSAFSGPPRERERRRSPERELSPARDPERMMVPVPNDMLDHGFLGPPGGPPPRHFSPDPFTGASLLGPPPMIDDFMGRGPPPMIDEFGPPMGPDFGPPFDDFHNGRFEDFPPEHFDGPPRDEFMDSRDFYPPHIDGFHPRGPPDAFGPRMMGPGPPPRGECYLPMSVVFCG